VELEFSVRDEGDARMSTVGKRLRKLRKDKGLTQTEVTGGQYSKEYVSQVELGKTKPSRRAVKLFAKYLDVDESYFETGVDLAGSERFESLMVNGEVLTERREYSEAMKCFDEARNIGEKAENQDFIWRSEVGRAWVMHFSGKRREALTILAEARAYYEDRHPNSVELAVIFYRVASIREALGDLKLSLLILDEALKIINRAPLPADHLRIRIYRLMASIHTKRHDLQAGREAAESALELAKTLDDRKALAEAYWESAVLEERRREFMKATEYALRARDILTELGDQQDMARLMCDLGKLKQDMGRYDEAVKHFETGLELLHAVDDPITRASLLNGLAESKLALGDIETSLDNTSKSLAILEGRDYEPSLQGAGHLLRAKSYLARKELGAARRELEVAKTHFEALETSMHLGSALKLEGDLLLVEGRTEEAAGTFRRALELIEMNPC